MTKNTRYTPLFESFIESESKRIAIQLQYGVENKPTEVVFASQYQDKVTGEWRFTKDQIRLTFAAEKVDSIITALQGLKKANAKVKKAISTDSPVTVTSIEELTVEQLTALLASKQASKKQEQKSEVVLTQSKTRRTSK